MKVIKALFTFAAISGIAKANRSCHGQRLYCGHSLTNMGWTAWDIEAGINKGTQWHPPDLGFDDYPDTLFECDGRSGGDALWYCATCEFGCADAEAGHSDYCYA